MNRLAKRVGELEGSGPFSPYCWVIANDDEDMDQAIARHHADDSCRAENHLVWVTA